jgi:hypothetical protein
MIGKNLCINVAVDSTQDRRRPAMSMNKKVSGLRAYRLWHRSVAGWSDLG